MKTLLLISLFLLSGCAGLGATGMTKDQLEALAKDDASTAFCTVISTLGVQVKSVYAKVDKGSAPLAIGAGCEVSYFAP